MLVLALDTSTPAVTTGLVRVLLPNEVIEALQAGRPAAPVQLLAERRLDDAFGHAEHLMPLTGAAVAEAGASLSDLNAVVVGLGPGPFTGLRVGVATAEALGDALGVPVYGVASHDGVALSIELPAEPADGRPPGHFLVVTDARRREIYASAFDGAARRIFGPAVMAPAALPGRVAELTVEPVALTGAGSDLAGLDLPRLTTGSTALGLVKAAVHKMVTGTVPGPLTPLYLRRPDVREPAGPKPVLA
jgi:tRNA threonylcarbamoyl adenosine modification protein YeaZ